MSHQISDFYEHFFYFTIILQAENYTETNFMYTECN